VTDADGNFDLYAVDVKDGRTAPRVVSPDHEARPQLSPDGTKPLLRWPANGRAATRRSGWRTPTAAPIELTAAPAPATHPSWAPDGMLAFQHRTDAGWEIWTLALPADIARAGHLRLAQQVRGGADVDTAKLRSGDTVRGTVQEATFRVRAAYGALQLPRAAVASIIFGDGEHGLARVVLANGDTVTGLVENTDITIQAGARSDRLAVERIAQLSLRAVGAAQADGAFRALMRNGDSLLVAAGFGPLRLRVGDRPNEIAARQIDHVDFAETGERATIVLVNGDSVSGELGAGRIELALAIGAKLSVHPTTIRSLVRAAAPARAGSVGG
jgi:hypothetical protein